ncbi:MAG: CoA-binding protein, partial [Rhodomicrobium sp.]
MTIRNLNFFFQPKRVALVGASETPGSIGLNVAENLLRAGFEGEIGFVNPKRSTVLGRPCYASSERLPFVPELGVVATPPQAVPGVIAELGR